ncbi:c-type cytochrome [Pseudomonas aeruginosa]|uniref:c-type cytochrome n=1 Tax=Pseudomonas aeruginosa TaxID=287 RepID=UPI001F43FE62|nr:c-type cytochrome [Pseudomonas aeruginosa]MDG4275157.1 c-type cytochrome [Pseudomonas aeruginosa]HBO3911641.1 c-type cytochrome [Pseudomonas aeruginosa]HCF5874564.1 c-type cytochrome [Pseudomonas aeruginosa]
MKRVLVIGAVVTTAALAVSSAIYGPELVAGYRFMEALDRHYADYQADGGAWPQLQDSCALCHGDRGQSRNAQYVSLAGLPAAYIEAQLHAFVDGRRHSPQMGPLAANLTDEQIETLAEYFARQTPERTEAPSLDTALEQRGQATVAARGCAACHAEGLVGGPLGPRLAGQGEGYLLDQLTAFKHGQRQDPAMSAMASTLSAEEIRATAHFLANQTPDTN